VYNTTRQRRMSFAYHRQAYQGNNTAAFYELFNEPTLYNGQLGSMSWSDWKEINENIIRLIRSYDRRRSRLLPVSIGRMISRRYTSSRLRRGIGYVTHPYGHKRPPPYEPKWDEDFGFAAGRYPVVATEFGFVLGNQSTGGEWRVWQSDHQVSRRSRNELDGMGVRSALVPSINQVVGWFPLTEGGEFFKQAMQVR